MNLQFFQYSNDTILKYETDQIEDSVIVSDVQNTILFDTLWGNKVSQKIRNPIDSYEFSLQGIETDTWNSFQDHLRLNNYWIKILYSKSGFWLETKRAGVITNIVKNDKKYKHLSLTDTNRLTDVTFTFTPYSWGN